MIGVVVVVGATVLVVEVILLSSTSGGDLWTTSSLSMPIRRSTRGRGVLMC